MKRFVALLFLSLVINASAQELQKLEKCTLVEAGWADGDSFPVKLPDGKEIVLRLYYVDCNEVAAHWRVVRSSDPLVEGVSRYH